MIYIYNIYYIYYIYIYKTYIYVYLTAFRHSLKHLYLKDHLTYRFFCPKYNNLPLFLP